VRGVCVSKMCFHCWGLGNTAPTEQAQTTETSQSFRMGSLANVAQILCRLFGADTRADLYVGPCSVESETLYAYSIPLHLLRELIHAHPVLEERLWKEFASILLKSYPALFVAASASSQRTLNHLHQMVTHAHYTHAGGRVISLKHRAMLLTGFSQYQSAKANKRRSGEVKRPLSPLGPLTWHPLRNTSAKRRQNEPSTAPDSKAEEPRVCAETPVVAVDTVQKDRSIKTAPFILEPNTYAFSADARLLVLLD
jgi:hypothetical protein